MFNVKSLTKLTDQKQPSLKFMWTSLVMLTVTFSKNKMINPILQIVFMMSLLIL